MTDQTPATVGEVRQVWRRGWVWPLVLLVIPGVPAAILPVIFFTLGGPVVAGVLVCAAYAYYVGILIAAIVRRKVTLTTDMLIIRNIYKTYRIPLARITKVNAAESGGQQAPGFRSTLHVRSQDGLNVYTKGCGYASRHAAETIAQAARAAGGLRQTS